MTDRRQLVDFADESQLTPFAYLFTRQPKKTIKRRRNPTRAEAKPNRNGIVLQRKSSLHSPKFSKVDENKSVDEKIKKLNRNIADLKNILIKNIELQKRKAQYVEEEIEELHIQNAELENSISKHIRKPGKINQHQTMNKDEPPSQPVLHTLAVVPYVQSSNKAGAGEENSAFNSIRSVGSERLHHRGEIHMTKYSNTLRRQADRNEKIKEMNDKEDIITSKERVIGEDNS